MKGGHPTTAHCLARTLTPKQWLPIGATVHGVELAPEGTIRRLLYEFWQPDGQPTYSLLYTNLPATELVRRGSLYLLQRTHHH